MIKARFLQGVKESQALAQEARFASSAAFRAQAAFP